MIAQEVRRRLSERLDLELRRRACLLLTATLLVVAPAHSQPVGLPMFDLSVGGVRFFVESERHLWIGGNSGLFRARLGDGPQLERMVDGWATSYERIGDRLWFGTDQGLYSWSEGDRRPRRMADLAVRALDAQDGILWIGADVVYRLDTTTAATIEPIFTPPPRRIEVSTETQRIREMIRRRIRQGARAAPPPRAAPEPPPVKLVQPEIVAIHRGKRYLWLGVTSDDYTDVLRFDVGGDSPVASLEELNARAQELARSSNSTTSSTTMDSDEIVGLFEYGDYLWIATDNGFYRWWLKADIRLMAAGLETYGGSDGYTTASFSEAVLHTLLTPDRLLVATDVGLAALTPELARRKPREELRLEMLNEEATGYYLCDCAGSLWLGPGISRLADDYELETVVRDGAILDMIRGAVTTLHVTERYFWLGTTEGLQTLRRAEGPWTPGVEFVNAPGSGEPGRTLGLRWRLTRFEENTTPTLARQRVLVTRRGEQQPLLVESRIDTRNAEQSTFSVTLALPDEPGDYRLTVEVTDLFGNAGLGEPLRLPVGLAWTDRALEWLKLGALFYAAGGLLLFVALAIGARWSVRCFDLLTDPHLSRWVLKFELALRHFGFLQRWVFHRYFRAIKAELADVGDAAPYLPAPLLAPDRRQLLTTDLFEELSSESKLLVVGAAGTGKTVMVEHLMRSFFGRDSLAEAWRHHRFIPIHIALRDFAHGTVAELVRAALRAHRFHFDSESFLDQMITGGNFLLVLDGLNESSIEQDLRQYVAVHPNVPMLLTSQTSLAMKRVAEYRLPGFEPEFVRQVLTANLDPATAQQVLERLGEALREIRSGYDVQLLIDLVRAERLEDVPNRRISLYEATVGRAIGDPATRSALLAQGWELWRSGRRRFEAGGEMTVEVLRQLETPPTSLVSRRGTREFELRHDLMRAFLAATWLARELSLPAALDQLTDSGVWMDVAHEDQRVMFGFYVELLESADDLTRVARFAAEDADRRQTLLVAAQLAANSRGLSLNYRTAQPEETSTDEATN